MRRPILALLLLLVAAGCEIAEITVENPRPLVVAEIYLRVTDGQGTGVALLQQTRGEGGVALADAVVQVQNDRGEEIPFIAAPLSSCVEGSVPSEFDAFCLRSGDGTTGQILPGGQYTARVELPDGRTLEGSMTMPGDFDLLAPARGVARCRIPPNQVLPIRWSQAAGARAYVPEAEIFGLDAALEPQGIDVPTDPLTLQGLAISESDTTIVFPSQFGIFNRFSDDRAVLIAIQGGFPGASVVAGQVIVSAQGRNSVNWNRGGNFNPSGTVRVPSLFGAGTGVFGGVVNRSFQFTTLSAAGVPSCLEGVGPG